MTWWLWLLVIGLVLLLPNLAVNVAVNVAARRLQSDIDALKARLDALDRAYVEAYEPMRQRLRQS